MTAAALEKKLRKAKPVLLAALKKESADFSFYIISNREMEKIRKQLMMREDFKGREARKIASEKEVNVLAFPEPKGFPDPLNKKKMLGEVYLNKDFGGKDYATLGPLFIHGLLHLLGYLHWTKRDTIRMQNLEKHLWEEITSL
jgi:ssRNA-specific RNase YbeY (16S rRNA maturation enzyme)